MKENWTYKKLGEICDVKTGKLDANASDENGLYPFFTCSKEPLRINTYSYDAECILIAGNGDLNVKYYNGKFDAYQRTYIITLKNGIADISVRYLYCFFLLYVETLRKKSIGGVIKYIKLGDITEAKVYIPSLSEQHCIVSELDLLQSIIDKQQAQLKELDNLAQAIFYDMFGDPVENEKGWEVKKLRDLCITITKGTTPTTLGYSFVSEGINFVKVESFKDGKIDASKLTHITKECHDALSRSQLDDLDLLVCIAGATIGKTAIADKSILPANTNQACAIIRLKNKSNLAYVQNYLMTKFKNDVEQMGKGVAQPNLSLGQMRELSIPLPPLSLQQSFAAKIESIEKQKAAISQSLAETQKLFDYTMDKYFG